MRSLQPQLFARWRLVRRSGAKWPIASFFALISSQFNFRRAVDSRIAIRHRIHDTIISTITSGPEQVDTVQQQGPQSARGGRQIDRQHSLPLGETQVNQSVRKVVLVCFERAAPFTQPNPNPDVIMS